MPRRPREAAGGFVYHVLNRGVGRMKLLEKDEDYTAFEPVLEKSWERSEIRIPVRTSVRGPRTRVRK